jgi:phage protein D
VGKFGAIDPDVPHRHHDAIEFPDGSNVLVTQLSVGQRATVLQLPVVHPIMDHAHSATTTVATRSVSVD